MSNEYLHCYPRDPASRMMAETIREENLSYKGKDILVVQRRAGENTFIIVPGAVVGTGVRGTVNFSRVETISSKSDRKKIEQQIRDRGLEGKISFW